MRILILYLFTSTIVLGVIDFYFVFICAKSFSKSSFKFNHFSLLLTLETNLEGQFRGKALPTYVYPDCLEAAIRERLSGDLRDYPNPETSAVEVLHYHAHYCYCYYCYKYSRTPLSPIFPTSRDSFFVVVLHLKYITSRLC